MIGPRLEGQDLDFEAWEFFVRGLVLKAGASALEATLGHILAEEDEAPLCANQHRPRSMRRAGPRPPRPRVRWNELLGNTDVSSIGAAVSSIALL